VIAPSFGAIFHGNCVRNGILPVVLDESRVSSLAARVATNPAEPITVDLTTCQITTADGGLWSFDVPPADREMLLEGLDGIAVTLKRDADIAAFQAADRTRRPWIYLPPVSAS
jgi:3-isopropylmalate/(R)-2-methylmalate dehydratase small subunit